MNLEEFLQKVCNRPLPNHPMVRVRTFAKEIAEGAVEGIWPGFFTTYGIEREQSVKAYLRSTIRHIANEYKNQLQKSNSNSIGERLQFALRIQVHEYREMGFRRLVAYIFTRWDVAYPDFRLLEGNEYLSFTPDEMLIKKAAYDLIEEVEPANVFISYKRSESSAFALLILSRLKTAGLEPFLDMAIVPGNDWQLHLQEQIRKSEYFILLLGKETLHSNVALKELSWAIEFGVVIIPIWHNEFVYQSDNWAVSAPINKVLSRAHTIRVIEESAVGYNNAIIELLNRFGITP